MEWVLGTAQLAGLYGVTRTKPVIEPEKLLLAAWEMGFSALDTARSYIGVEEVIGASGWPGQIHSKLAGEHDVDESLHQSLKALRRDNLDILYFHDPSVVEDRPEVVAKTKELLIPRYAKWLGVSVYSPAQFTKAVDIPAVDAIQVPMNILDRRLSEEALEKAATHKLIYARSIFLQGVLLSNPHELPGFLSGFAQSLEVISQLSNDSGLSQIDLAVGWVVSRPGLKGLVVGVESVQQLREIGRALKRGPLDKGVIRLIEEIRPPHEDLLDPRKWDTSHV